MLDRAAVRGQLAQDHLQQRGLARAIGADQTHLVAAQDGAAEIAHHGAAAEGLGDVFQLGHDLAAAIALGDIQLDATDHLTAGCSGAAQLVQALDAGHRAGTTGFHALADPDFFLRQQFVELGVGDGFVGQLLGLEPLVGREVARVGAQLTPIELDDAGTDVVQERSVVRDQHDGALECHQQLFQPGDRVQVQVVGRLVQEEHVGAGHQRTRQRHPLLGAARQAVNRQARIQAQALQGLVHPLFPVPAIARFDEGHQGIQVGAFLVGLEALTGCLDLGQTLADGAEHGGAVGKAGLLRHIGDVDAVLHLQQTVVGLFQPSHDLQQRGLARAIAADQANAFTGFERKGGVVEQGHVAIGQAGIAQGQKSHERNDPERKKKAPAPLTQVLIVAAGAARRSRARR